MKIGHINLDASMPNEMQSLSEYVRIRRMQLKTQNSVCKREMALRLAHGIFNTKPKQIQRFSTKTNEIHAKYRQLAKLCGMLKRIT